MADISKIVLPNSNEYNVKDAAARSGLASKQDTLVSGTNIKTINNTSLLGSGNINVSGGGSDVFIAEYNITTYAEILAAIEDEQKIIIKKKEGDAQSPDVLYYVNKYTVNSYEICLDAIGYDSHMIAHISSEGVWSYNNPHFRTAEKIKAVILYESSNFYDIQQNLQYLYYDGMDVISFIDDPSYGFGLIVSYSYTDTSSQGKIEFTALLESTSNRLPYRIKYTVIKKYSTGAVTWSRDVMEFQQKLVSGTSIKTINSNSLLGSGNIAVQECLVSGTNIKTINNSSLLGNGNIEVQELLNSGINIKTINNTSLLGAGDISLLNADSTLSAAKLTGAITNGVTATTQSSRDNSTKIATTAYVDGAINDLPEPMIFQGSLGEGGTISTLPTASSLNKGYTYKVITAGTYDSKVAKIGDTFISDSTEWILIPSGDEPSGTVTSIATGDGLTGGPVTTSGTISVVSNSIPTANTIAKFDAAAHMNSTDMTSSEISAFVGGLDLSSTKAVDYIVEQGTDGIWTYRKWQSGIAECWGYSDIPNRNWTKDTPFEVRENLPFAMLGNPKPSVQSSGFIAGLWQTQTYYTNINSPDNDQIWTYLSGLDGTSNKPAGVFWHVAGRWK